MHTYCASLLLRRSTNLHLLQNNLAQLRSAHFYQSDWNFPMKLSNFDFPPAETKPVPIVPNEPIQWKIYSDEPTQVELYQVSPINILDFVDDTNCCAQLISHLSTCWTLPRPLPCPNSQTDRYFYQLHLPPKSSPLAKTNLCKMVNVIFRTSANKCVYMSAATPTRDDYLSKNTTHWRESCHTNHSKVIFLISHPWLLIFLVIQFRAICTFLHSRIALFLFMQQ